MSLKDLFRSKSKLQEEYDLKLLEYLTTLNEYQSMIVESVINQWPIDTMQKGYIKSYINFELTNSLKIATPYCSSELLLHLETRQHDFKRLYELLERSEK